MLTTTQARSWLDRWDRQQERYIADREERFAVIADVVAATARNEQPRILDLGCGPGSLSVRLLDRLPAGEVVGLDADPLLLCLARTGYGDREGLTLVERELRSSGWVDGLGEFDAVVSTTALHWLTHDELAAVYLAVGHHLLRPGGIFVDGDHLAGGWATLDRIAKAVETGRAERAGVLGNEEWQQWWDAVADALELRELASERGARPVDHSVPQTPTLPDHEALLRAAGFGDVGTVWQCGTDRVLVAIR